MDTTDLTVNREYDINGTLMDATIVSIANKTVELYVDGEVIDSATTDENGVFSFKYTPADSANVTVQVKYSPEDYYLNSESKMLELEITENDSNITPQPKPPAPQKPAHTHKITHNRMVQTKTHTIKLASDNSLVFTGNALTLEALNKIFDLNLTNGHLLVYIDGVLVFNATTSDDVTMIILELLDKYLGKHEIKVVFTDNENQTHTYNENVIIG